MRTAPLQVLVCMSGFSVHCGWEGFVRFWHQQGVKALNGPISLSFLLWTVCIAQCFWYGHGTCLCLLILILQMCHLWNVLWQSQIFYIWKLNLSFISYLWSLVYPRFVDILLFSHFYNNFCTHILSIHSANAYEVLIELQIFYLWQPKYSLFDRHFCTNPYEGLSGNHQYFNLATIFILSHLWTLNLSLFGSHILLLQMYIKCYMSHMYFYFGSHICSFTSVIA